MRSLAPRTAEFALLGPRFGNDSVNERSGLNLCLPRLSTTNLWSGFGTGCQPPPSESSAVDQKPPHGGAAPGVDRIVMLLADEPNIREVILFPLNQQGEDLMMQAPAGVPPARLKELHIKLDLPPAKGAAGPKTP